MGLYIDPRERKGRIVLMFDFNSIYIVVFAASMILLSFSLFTGSDFEILPGIPAMAILFVSLFFGVTGWLFEVIGINATVTLVAASIVSLIAGGVITYIFRWLSRNETSSHVNDKELEGSVAKVHIPFSDKRKGVITTQVAGAHTKMTAIAVEGVGEIKAGMDVLLLGFKSNVALVTPLSDDLVDDETQSEVSAINSHTVK